MAEETHGPDADDDPILPPDAARRRRDELETEEAENIAVPRYDIAAGTLEGFGDAIGGHEQHRPGPVGDDPALGQEQVRWGPFGEDEDADREDDNHDGAHPVDQDKAGQGKTDRGKPVRSSAASTNGDFAAEHDSATFADQLDGGPEHTAEPESPKGYAGMDP